MRKIVLAAAMLPVLTAACSDEQSEAEIAADVAEIRATHDMPPIQPIEPQRISYTDIENNNLFGMGCGFAAGTSAAVLVLAQAENAYMKLDGAIVSFSPDKGSVELPFGAYTRYTGDAYALEIGKASGDPVEAGIETIDWKGRVVVTDSKERPVYDATGTLQCGS